MDEDNCMVDVARYFIEFTHSESCGKCVPCRVGTGQGLAHPQRNHHSSGRPRDLTLLVELGRDDRECSLCGLGQNTPTPRAYHACAHFREEYEDHIVAHRCRAGVCQEADPLRPARTVARCNMNIPAFLSFTARDGLRTPSSPWSWTTRFRLDWQGLPASLRQPLPAPRL